jgi:hypothetical protein
MRSISSVMRSAQADFRAGARIAGSVRISLSNRMIRVTNIRMVVNARVRMAGGTPATSGGKSLADGVVGWAYDHFQSSANACIIGCVSYSNGSRGGGIGYGAGAGISQNFVWGEPSRINEYFSLNVGGFSVQLPLDQYPSNKAIDWSRGGSVGFGPGTPSFWIGRSWA